MRDKPPKQHSRDQNFNNDVFRVITENSSDYFLLTDAEGIILYLNRLNPSTGLTYEQLIGASIFDLTPEPQRPNLIEQCRQVLTMGTPCCLPYNYPLLDGSISVYELRIAPLVKDGGTAQMVFIFTDITDRASIEAALHESEEQHRQLYVTADDGIMLTRLDGSVLAANPSACRILQYTEDELCKLGRAGVVNLHDPRLQVLMEERQRTGKAQGELTFVRSDGTLIPVEASSTIFTDRFGITRVSVIFRDITQRQQHQAIIHKLSRAIEQTADSVVITNCDGIIEYVNSGFEQLTGYTADEVIGQTPRLLKSGYHDLKFFQDMWQTLLDGRVFRSVVVNRKKNSDLYYVEKTISPLRDELGHITHFISTDKDITERKRAEEQLQFQATLLEQVSDAIIATDIDLCITSWNPGAQKMYGWTASEVMGRQINEILKTEFISESQSKARHRLLTEGVWKGEVRQQHKDGSQLDIATSASVLRDSEGKIIGGVRVNQDITKHKKMQEAIQAKETAEAADLAKSAFLASMSHEIRTPLNGVIGMTELLLDTDLSPIQRQFTEIVHFAGENLLMVINDILDFSKIEAGKLDLEIVDFDLHSTIEKIMTLLTEKAYQKNLTVSYIAEPGIPQFLRGDVFRLTQILTNLINNAIKFTDHGHVVLQVGLCRKSDQPYCVRFEVRDTGIGISPEQQARLFQSFSQADASMTRKYGGTGLGLVITKRLVELMGGKIGFTSDPGIGSIFWFTVGFDQAREEVHFPPAPEVNLQGRTIFIVDDSAMNRRILQQQVTALAMTCDTASSGAETLEKLHAAYQQGITFDAVILDMQMFGMNGLELAQIIKMTPSLSHLRLIMTTSIAEHIPQEQTQATGIAACLTKPVHLSELRQCLATVFQKPTGNLFLPSTVTTPLSEDKPELQARILVAEDNIINQQVARRMLEKRGFVVDVVKNGFEAVKAVEQKSYVLVFMDCQMPDMDGYAATAEIRRHQGLQPRIPIIALTAHALSGEREKCIEAGMDDYLTKPLNQKALEEIFRRWVQLPNTPST